MRFPRQASTLSTRYVFVHAGLDRDNDCCAPLGGEGAGDKPEPRGCSIPGFVVKPDPTGRSGWAPCHAAFGTDATYKCTPVSSEKVP